MGPGNVFLYVSMYTLLCNINCINKWIVCKYFQLVLKKVLFFVAVNKWRSRLVRTSHYSGSMQDLILFIEAELLNFFHHTKPTLVEFISFLWDFSNYIFKIFFSMTFLERKYFGPLLCNFGITFLTFYSMKICNPCFFNQHVFSFFHDIFIHKSLCQ